MFPSSGYLRLWYSDPSWDLDKVIQFRVTWFGFVTILSKVIWNWVTRFAIDSHNLRDFGRNLWVILLLWNTLDANSVIQWRDLRQLTLKSKVIQFGVTWFGYNFPPMTLHGFGMQICMQFWMQFPTGAGGYSVGLNAGLFEPDYRTFDAGLLSSYLTGVWHNLNTRLWLGSRASGWSEYWFEYLRLQVLRADFQCCRKMFCKLNNSEQ